MHGLNQFCILNLLCRLINMIMLLFTSTKAINHYCDRFTAKDTHYTATSQIDSMKNWFHNGNKHRPNTTTFWNSLANQLLISKQNYTTSAIFDKQFDYVLYENHPHTHKRVPLSSWSCWLLSTFVLLVCFLLLLFEMCRGKWRELKSSRVKYLTIISF